MAYTYRLERSDDGLTGWTVIAENLTELSLDLIDQGTGVVKYYRIFRVVSDYDVAVSNVLEIALISEIQLVAIGGVGRDKITLQWSDVSSPTYAIYKYHPRLMVWRRILTTSNTVAEDRQISNGILYWYYVVGLTSEGVESLPSNLASAIITKAGIFTMSQSRATNYQGIQLGIESTPGTQVPATRRIVGLELIQTPEIPIKTVKYQGYKGASGTQRGQRHTEAKFSGALDFAILPYLISLGYGAATTSTANGGTTWNWRPNSVEKITPISATIEQGSVSGAEKFGFATLSDLSFKWGKEDASIEGTIFGQEQTRNATMTRSIIITVVAEAASGGTSMSVTVKNLDGTTATGSVPAGTYVVELPYTSHLEESTYVTFTVSSPATITAGAATLTVSALGATIAAGSKAMNIREVASVPVHCESIGVYISTDGVDWTLLEDTIEGSVDLNGLFKPCFKVNPNNPSFSSIVELGTSFGASITTEEGTEADAFMSYLDSGQKVWLGIKALGPVINASPLVRHTFQFYMPVFVVKPDPGDQDDVYGNVFTFEHAHDAVFGMFDLTIVNRIPAL